MKRDNVESNVAGQLYMDGTKLNRHLAEVVKWQNGDWFPPIHMEVSLANVCNQKCTFCYIIWAHGKILMPGDMACDLMRSAKEVGVKSVLIAGEGEPTANPAYVETIEAAGEAGLDVALNTNAVRLDDDALRRILPHLSWVRFSFQGSHKDLYADIHQVPEQHFEKAVGNIRRAAEIKKELGLDVTLGMQQVLLKENGSDAFNTAKLAKSLGCDYYVIKPCHPHDNNEDYQTIANLVETHRDTLEKAVELSDDDFKAVVRWNFLAEAEAPRDYHRCLGLPFIVQITADGRVVTCYPHSDKEQHSYGSLTEAQFADIVRSPEFGAKCRSIGDTVDVHNCMPTCRQHNANKFLWWLEEEKPTHFNFI